MQLGILITTFNRAGYLQECLESVRRADIPTGTKIVIVDDASTEASAIQLLQTCGYDVIRKSQNSGIWQSLVTGFDYLVQQGCSTLMNLDGDAIIRNDAIQKITELPDQKIIKTGFNCRTKNRDGSERHKIVCESSDGKWNIKASVGGINMCFNTSYWQRIRAVIVDAGINHKNWDHMTCLELGGAISVGESVVQHIGLASSMGHHEPPDIAEDFIPLILPDVTLIGADDNAARIWHVAGFSMQNIKFADCKIFSAQAPYSNIPVMGSKKAYSEFIMHELYKHISTSHMLIVQHDGYVKNYKAWSSEFLQYDYIGAPWMWYKDGMNVGNGGFSLRSRRIMELCSTLPLKTDKDDNGNYAEDHSIARIYRPYLESKGMKFAPVEVAAKFSIEGYGLPVHLRKYNGQFGFHGSAVKF